MPASRYYGEEAIEETKTSDQPTKLVLKPAYLISAFVFITVAIAVVMLNGNLQSSPQEIGVSSKVAGAPIENRQIITAVFVSSTADEITITDDSGTKHVLGIAHDRLEQQNSVDPAELAEGEEVLVFTVTANGTEVVERVRYR